jgi:predicted RNA-binding protein with PUA-like domain
MAFWLFKSDPESYSFGHLLAERGRSTGWSGVRNYQARNWLRDTIGKGDQVLIYHSGLEPAIAGIAEVTKAGHPDPTALDPNDDHFDPKSESANPIWYQVTIKALRAIKPPLPLALLRTIPELANMELLRKGSRLSIQPVSETEWLAIEKLAKVTSAKKG